MSVDSGAVGVRVRSRISLLSCAFTLLTTGIAAVVVAPGRPRRRRRSPRSTPPPFALDPSDSFQRYGALVDEIEATGRVRKAPTLSSVLDGPQDFHPTWGLCHSTGIAAARNPTGFCWRTLAG